MSLPIDAFGPDRVLMNPIFTLSAACTAMAAASPIARTIARMLLPLSLFALNAHLVVDDLAALDDDLAIELDRAVAHRHVVVPACIALAAALRVRPGREKKIARERARCGAMPLGQVAVQGDAVPQRLRIHAPTQMRDRVWIAIGGRGLAVLEPGAHQLGVRAAL